MKNTFILICSTLLIAACSSGVKVTSDQADDVDFTTYKTYSFLGWQKDSDKMMNELDKKRMRDAFKNELESRNLTFVEEGGDMSIALFLVIDQKTSTTAYTDYYGGGYGRYGRYRGGWGTGYSTTTYTQSDYLQGTLVMDVFDEPSGKQIWQGIAVGTVTEKAEKREKTIPQSIAKLMGKFPIKKVESK